jgi:hypothetical protein
VRLAVSRSLSFALVAFTLGLTGCQSSMGSPGLPQAPGGYAPAAAGGGAGGPAAVPYTRTRTVEGAVYLLPSEADVPLPAVGGFQVSLALHAATPSPSPSPRGASPAASAAGSPGAAVAAGSPGPATAPASPSAAPPVTAPSAGASAPANAVAGASSSPKSRRATAAPSGPKIDTKTTIYPSDAPPAPSPAPTGNVQTFLHQTAIVRGYFLPETDLALNSLDAVRFTIPKEEQTPNRSFIVALYDLSKKHHPRLVAFSADTSLSSGVVTSSGETDPLKLSKGTAYAVVLYGDELPATPPPVQTSPIPPAQNPFATPMPNGYPPGNAPPPGYQPATYPPGYPTPTPYNGGR